MGNNDGHIDFSRWEAGEPLDEAHLASCAECREEREAALFIRRQAARMPSIEAPPFFAPRVARLAFEQEARPLFTMVQLVARRLLPVFMALMLAVVSLAYWSSGTTATQPLAAEHYEALALLLQEESAPQQVTMDDVFDLMAQNSEGGSVDQPK